ncbi:MAG: TetR family transcriptional regulator [Chloroflexi bacterium]|nr:TetR family transcriptional regulator [Chloroflexota bacterium]
MATHRLDHATRQRQIAAAARDIIIEGGLASLTVNELAGRVGVTEAALYKHVKNKDQILLLLVAEIGESLFSAISEATSTDRNALEKLEHMLQLHLSYAEARRGVSFVIISEALRFGVPEVRSAARRLVDDYVKLVAETIKSGQDAAEIDASADSEAAAVMFFGMVEASVTRWLFDESLHPLEEKGAAMWKLFKAGIQADTVAARTVQV